MFKSLILNENNIQLGRCGQAMLEAYSKTPRENHFEPTNTFDWNFYTGEKVHAEFSREENGVRIYNIIGNWIK